MTLTSDPIESDLPAAADLRPYPAAPWRLYGVLAALLFAVVIFPTLGWLEFGNGSENLVTQSVLEIVRGGPELVPTLEGQPRVAKPPLTTWIDALPITRNLVDKLNTPAPVARSAFYTELAMRLRLMALASTVLMLLAVGELGRTLGGGRLGLLALLIAASSALVLRFGRYATTDVQLALWVTIANWMLARAILRGKWFSGFSLAGAALGLAMMSKGPVCLVQTILPAACFLIWRRVGKQNVKGAGRGVVVGLLLFALIGLPWFLWVAVHEPNVWPRWFSEVTRLHATDIEPRPWFSFLSIVPYVLPWTAYLLAGLAMAALQIRRGKEKSDGRTDGLVLAAMLGVIPLLVMSLAKDKNERYELPMIGPMAVVSAFALEGAMQKRRVAGVDRTLVIVHVCTVAAVAAGLAVAGGFVLRRLDGRFWYDAGDMIGLLVVAGMVLLALPFVLSRPWRLADCTLVVALWVQVMFFTGYCNSADARSPLRPVAERIRELDPARNGPGGPQADVWYFDPRPMVALPGEFARRTLPVDLSIYLNRVVSSASEANSVVARDAVSCLAVVLQRPDEPPPPVPPNWVQKFSVPEPGSGKRARTWHVYLVADANPLRTGSK